MPDKPLDEAKTTQLNLKPKSRSQSQHNPKSHRPTKQIFIISFPGGQGLHDVLWS